LSGWNSIGTATLLGDLCRNYEGKTKKINICFCRKFIKQKLKKVGIDSGKQKNKQEVLVESKAET
jgi:hypothetical protein